MLCFCVRNREGEGGGRGRGEKRESVCVSSLRGLINTHPETEGVIQARPKLFGVCFFPGKDLLLILNLIQEKQGKFLSHVCIY